MKGEDKKNLYNLSNEGMHVSASRNNYVLSDAVP
jgi:hypothetical protein